MHKPRYILGFDLSLTSTGVALLDTQTQEIIFDEINTTSKQPFEERIKTLRDGLRELYREFEHLSPYISVELPAGSQSAKANKCGAGAIATFFCSPFGDLPQAQYGPKSIKQLVGSPDIKGYDRKRLNINKALEIYPDSPFPKDKNGMVRYKYNHQADALLLCYLAYIDF